MVYSSESEGDSLSMVVNQPRQEVAIDAPIVASCNDRIRPLLDAVDELRHLMVMKEGIQLPTIVVVGDQSSGKSSVLESLAGISLPRGQGICTRVPLVMRLQHHHIPEPELYLEFNGKTVQTTESRISEAINLATDEIAGNGKGVSNTPLTLVVKKHGVPDLTMVDLPGITRVPVHDQPENIYEQIAGIIMEYIKPDESIILNVLSATVDFSTCESIRMSQQVDKTGERTLAVVTKVDKAPEGLLEKVTADDVNVGLGYVCVRNRIGDETYEEARRKEAALFESHPLLCLIDKSIVGVPVLAQKLVQIQAAIIMKCLPEIVKKINDKLNSSLSEFNKLPKTFTSIAEAMTAFMGIIAASKESLRKIILRGEFDEYPDDQRMHCTARLGEMINQCSQEMQNHRSSDLKKNFLMDEISVLDEAIKGIRLPNFLPHSVFIALLCKKVDSISSMPIEFVEKVWTYIEGVMIEVLTSHSDNYHQLQIATRRACLNLVAKMKQQSLNWVMEIIQMEKLTDYTCNPEYLLESKKLMAKQDKFMDDVFNAVLPSAVIYFEGFGGVEVVRLREHKHVVPQAYDLKARMTAYWKIVLRRLVDSLALHLQLSVHNLVDKELEKEIVNELMMNSLGGGGVEKLLGESPSVAGKREKLSRTIKLLQESKKVLARIVDEIATA
ncbi:hypothetical protein HS088_TW22G00939 [Tripterygium wilfordii]|uniref:Dynamin-related protein 4C-like n=1 Tax=Tripterygium wilfordii TaxID=458696 RepID=A0A7J7BZB3_TRIWF|nr:hypothetical protein HS088_TW22G00939 [Tripterygium wilfordii]